MLHLIVLSVISAFALAANFDCSQPLAPQDFVGCCKETEQAKKILDRCAQRLGKDSLCMSECFFNETGIISNGHFQADKMLDILLDFYSNYPDMAAAVKKVLPNCLRNARANAAKIQDGIPEGTLSCSTLPLAVSGCLGTEIFVNCPTSLRTESEKCDKAREFAKACLQY